MTEVTPLNAPGSRNVSTGELAAQIAQQRERANSSAQKVGGINANSKKTPQKRAKKLRRMQNVQTRAAINRDMNSSDSRNWGAVGARLDALAKGANL